MKRILSFLVVSLALSSGVFAGECVCPDEPEGCTLPSKYAVCLKRAEAKRVALQQVELEELRALRRIGARRFGFTFGPGLGVSGIVTDEFDVKWVPAGGAYIVWGFHF